MILCCSSPLLDPRKPEETDKARILSLSVSCDSQREKLPGLDTLKASPRCGQASRTTLRHLIPKTVCNKLPAGTSSPTLPAIPSLKRLRTSYFLKKLESVELSATLCPPGSRLAAAIYSLLPAGASLPARERRNSDHGSPEEQVCIPRRRHRARPRRPPDAHARSAQAAKAVGCALRPG